MRAERYWSRAVAVSQRALETGALIPLSTCEVQIEGIEPFVLRKLTGRPSLPPIRNAVKANPFLPWEPFLEVECLEKSHALILNKYPVQPSHLLLITQQWQPQTGWLTALDWRAVAHVAADTGGLWFFNSGPTAGASQPHRHLQLLPRHQGEISCPLAPLFQRQLQSPGSPWAWRYALSARWDAKDGADLLPLYLSHASLLELGDPAIHGEPRHAYNLLFDDHWFLTVRRVKEHCAGFSVNGLGFAGFLLCTAHSDVDWLKRNGPWTLLEHVAAPSG